MTNSRLPPRWSGLADMRTADTPLHASVLLSPPTSLVTWGRMRFVQAFWISILLGSPTHLRLCNDHRQTRIRRATKLGTEPNAIHRHRISPCSATAARESAVHCGQNPPPAVFGNQVARKEDYARFRGQSSAGHAEKP